MVPCAGSSQPWSVDLSLRCLAWSAIAFSTSDARALRCSASCLNNSRLRGSVARSRMSAHSAASVRSFPPALACPACHATLCGGAQNRPFSRNRPAPDQGRRWASGSAKASNKAQLSIARIIKTTGLVHDTNKIVADATDNENCRHDPKQYDWHWFPPPSSSAR